MQQNYSKFLLAAALLFSGGSSLFAQTDVTSQYLKNADLSSMDGWTANNFNKAVQGSTKNDGYASESYAGWGSLEKKDYSLTQKVTLPAGKYELVNYSFYREGERYNTDANTSRAYLKAGDEQVAIKTLGSIKAAGYANSQAEGANVFSTMMYRNTLDFTLTEEKTIEIGVVGNFTQMRSWCIVGGFQLLDMNKTPNAQDVTYLLTNPGFEYRDMTGWTLEGTSKFGTQGNNSFDNKAGGYYAEKWQSSSLGGLADGKMSQSLTGLTNGKYRVSAYIYFGGTGAYIQAGDTKTDVPANASGRYSAIANVTDGNLTIAAGLQNATSNWVCFDRFTLEYLPDVIDDATANALIAGADTLKTKPMDADVKAALETAITNLTNNKISDNYLALETAVNNAKSSAAAYAHAKSVLDNRAKLLEATNFYTADASFYNTPLAAYEAGSLTDAEANALEDPYGATKIGWHASTQLNQFFGAAWGFSDYNSPLYVNTWSWEGDNDGSNFKVPFYEYFANSNTPLSARTFTGTLTGLTPGWYKVSLDAREQLVNAQNTAVNGISMNVNDGESVELNKGVKTADNNNLFYANYTAYGQVGEDGVLKLNIVVADGNNVHWLSFQHVKYAPLDVVNLDETATDAPEATTAPVNATLTRTFNAGWNSIVLPFATTIEALGADEAAEYEGTEGSTINFKKVAELQANTPYLVHFAAETSDVTFNAVTIAPATELTVADANNQFDLVGNYTAWTAETSQIAAGDYIVVTDGIQKAAGKNVLKGYRAFLKAKTAEAAAKSMSFSIDGTVVTGIDVMQINDAVNDGNIYNLAGQRVDKSYKGIVIKNGKKVIKK